MFEKRLKAVDLAKGTNIAPSVISRYLSGQNQPSADNLIAIGNYFDAHPQSLLSPSDAPESSESPRGIPSDKDKIIAIQEELIKNLQKQVGGLEKQVKEWEDWKASSKDRYAKGREKTKNPTKPNKQKVGFLRKPKYKTKK